MKPRIYDAIVSHSLKNFRQMVFLSGPRQVGKTTVAKAHANNTENAEVVFAGLGVGRRAR